MHIHVLKMMAMDSCTNQTSKYRQIKLPVPTPEEKINPTPSTHQRADHHRRPRGGTTIHHAKTELREFVYHTNTDPKNFSAQISFIEFLTEQEKVFGQKHYEQNFE